MNLRYNRSILAEMHDDLILAEKDLRIIISTDPSNATALNASAATQETETDDDDDGAPAAWSLTGTYVLLAVAGARAAPRRRFIGNPSEHVHL